MWYSYLGLALAAGEQGGLLGAALANPVLAAALPVAAAHVTVAVEEVAMDLGLAYIGPDDAGDEPGTDTAGAALVGAGAWVTGWCVDFIRDYKASNFGMEDRRGSNGGGQTEDCKKTYKGYRKAYWINAADQLELEGDPHPVAAALRQYGGILPQKRARGGKLAPNHNYSRMMGNICRWRTEPARTAILDEAALSRSEKRGAIKPTGGAVVHYPEMEEALRAEILAKRARKRRVSVTWIRKRAREMVEGNPDWAARRDTKFLASDSWRACFMRRQHLCMRRKTNSKRKSVLERRNLLLGWHRWFRRHMRSGDQQCPVYGRYDREHRFNVLFP
jgi:hypothetical protein